MATIQTKKCSKCKKIKPTAEFSQTNPNRDGYNSWCKSCVNLSSARWSLTPSGIYSSAKYQRRNNKPFTMTREEFCVWYANQEKRCAYCDLPENLISKIDDVQLNRTRRFGLDCKDNEVGYTIDNIVLSCLRCNFIKNDFLGFDAMRYIGQNFVKPIWEERLGFRLP